MPWSGSTWTTRTSLRRPRSHLFGDGHSNFPWQDDGDPIAHFPNYTYGGQPSEVNVVDVTPDENGPGASYVPTFSLTCGNYGCGTGLPGLRGQSAAAGKSQTFWDLTYMGTNYTGLGAIQNDISFWINIGGTEAVVKLSPSIVPTTSEVCIDDSTTVDIKINEVTNLYGYQFQVNYSTVLVSAANPGAFDITWFDTNGNGLVPPLWGPRLRRRDLQVCEDRARPGRGSQRLGHGSPGDAQQPGCSRELHPDHYSGYTLGRTPDHAAHRRVPALTVCGLANVSGV